MRDGKGLDIFFDPAIDGGGWPGVLGLRRAAAGRAWLGPVGLLERLEVELGLTAPWLGALERACAFAAHLRERSGTSEHAGWWHASLEADAIGTALRLLRDRDLLVAHGWRGEPAGPRLDALWTATALALHGPADRVRAVAAALATGDVDVERVCTASPLKTLDPGWRALFARLAERGTRVEELAQSVPPTSSGPSDLGRAQAVLEDGGRFSPEGDGSLVLLRTHGPVAAADQVAAHLAERAGTRGLEGVLVVGGDEVLDLALSRHGLPRTGGAEAEPASAALVGLVIESAFRPMDPADLHALLCLQPGPVPRALASELVRALRDLPARGTTPWREALAKGLERMDAEGRERVRVRLEVLLEPAAPRDGRLTVAELVRRLHDLATWARGRQEAVPSLAACALAAETLGRTTRALGSDALTRIELRRLAADVAARLATPAEAGIAHVGQPGAVLGKAELTVWWGFTRDRAPRAQRLRLSQAERAALTAAGVVVPDPGAAMDAEALRWRRPLVHAREQLVLVAPSFDATGERAFPHPLWDELVAAAGGIRGVAPLETRALRVPTRVVAYRPVGVPATAVRVPTALKLREEESPSSLETLLGCSLAWAFRYPSGLKPGLTTGPPPPGPLLFGSLAHHLLAEVFRAGSTTPDALRTRAESVVDAELDRICESLALPRRQVERTRVRQAVVRSAERLGELLSATRATVRGTEMDATARLAGTGIRGRADLVLHAPDVVLDLKWGASTNREHLVRGTALQLAAYAELFAVERCRPETAFFTLERQELLGEHASTIPGARTPGPHRAADVWRAAEAAIRSRAGELERGQLAAPAADGTKVEAGLTGGGITIAPHCEYCDFDGLCGRGGQL